ncbi:MAG: hypothetical protein H9535_19430 [Ignavibacteria bacterium]|nr:hypothetical protein [Ignavibacteria bacterium]
MLICLMCSSLSSALLWGQNVSQQGLDPNKHITQYVHESWQIREGLPQNSVQSIAQTSDGYLWFTTQEGLVRFDGLRFTVYNKKNSALPENYCNSLVTDKSSGTIWVATQTQGIVRLQNGVFTTFTTRHGLSSNFTPENGRALAMGADNSLWIATLGGGVNRLKDGHVTVYSMPQGLSNDNVHTLFFSNDSTLWIGTENGLNILNTKTNAIQQIVNPALKSSQRLTNNVIQSITTDKEGNLWIGTINGLQRLKGGVWTIYTTKNGLPGNHIRTLYCDSKGTLWIGTLGAGMCRFSKGVFSAFSLQDGLTHPDIFDMYEDVEGSLYIGTGGGGLNRLRNGSVTVYSRRLGLSDPWSIMEDSTGNMWFSMFANGVSVINNKTNGVQHFSTANGLPSNAAHGMMQDSDGSVWLGTRDKGMCHVVNGKIVKSYGIKDGLPNERVRVFLRDRKGRLWIGTDKGASCFANGVFANYGKAEGLVDGRTPVLHEDSQGRIWVGTREGLFVIENDRVVKSYTVKDGMAGDNIIWLYEDKEHTFWIGTTNGGLHRLKNDSLYAYTTQNGLFDDSVFSVLEDENGWLWMSCSKGIFRVKKSELEEVAQGRKSQIACITYDKDDGMASPECNGASQPAACKSRDGRLWFPTIAGVVVINPNNLVKNNLPPTVIIENVLADGIRIGGKNFEATSEGTFVENKSNDQPSVAQAQSQNQYIPVTLEPTTEKFEFHYTATCLTAADRSKFKYILEGYDKTWVDAGGRRAAYYTNLPHDRMYRFRVIACNNDGVWNEVGASTTFFMKPFWYETWKFYLACVVGFVLAGFLLYRWRVHSLREKAVVLERVVNERTADLNDANLEIKRQIELLSERAREIEFVNVQLYDVNKNLQGSNKALDEVNRFKTQMLSMVSHDLKNPLTTVLLASKSLRVQVADNTDALEMTEMIRDSAETMHKLITEILDQAALEHGQLEIRTNKLQLEEICLELIHEYQYRAQDKQQQLQTEIADYCSMYGDENRLRQVFDNLISNAIKYSPPKSNIIVRLYKEENFNNSIVRFEVQDEGPGLTQEDQQKLFGFFQRLSSKPTGGESSTGVGLAIVKQIVELHGGRVWCESEPGNGATFIVELPLLHVAANNNDSSVVIAGSKRFLSESRAFDYA